MTARVGSYHSRQCRECLRDYLFPAYGGRYVCHDCSMNGRLDTPPMTDDDDRHGTDNGYRNLGCRRECCRRAHRRKCQAEKSARISRGIPEYVHGTANGYQNYDCRCERCFQGMKISKARRKRVALG